MGGLSGALGQGQAYDAQQMQRQMAYINQYQDFTNAYDGWITAKTLSTGTTSNITISGITITPDEVDYDPVRQMVRKKDEFAWLRGRVEEMCWKQAA